MVSKRLQIIKQKAEYLNSIREQGLDLLAPFSTDQLVFDEKAAKFGRIVSNSKHYFTIEFKDGRVTYFRKPGWKPCKETFLCDHYRSMTNKDLAVALGCSEKIIEKKLSKLKLKRNFEWDGEKDDYLIKHLNESNQWLSEQLGTTVSSIKGRIFRLKAKGIIAEGKSREVHNWTTEDDTFLRDNLHLPNRDLAEKFDVPISTIKSRLRKLREMGVIREHRKRGKKDLN